MVLHGVISSYLIGYNKMMKKLISTCLFLAYSTSSAASTNEGNYLRADIGVSIPSTRIKDAVPLIDGSRFRSAPVYSLGMGYNYSGPLRTDFNIQYRRLNYKHSNANNSVKQRTKNFTLFWNGYIDAENESGFVPYLTGGIGYSRLFPGRATETSSGGAVAVFNGRASNNFAWNVGAGSKVKLADNVALDLTYRYTTLGRVKFSDSVEGPYGTTAGKPTMLRTHEITLGLVYSF